MEIQQQKPTAKQLVVGVLLALPAGLLAPSFFPFALVGPVALSFLFTYGGAIPFAVCAILQLVTANLLGGMTLTLITLLSSLLPAAFAARVARWRRPFFDQMRFGVAAQVAGVLASVIFIYARYGSDLIPRMVQGYGAQLEGYSSEAVDMVLAMRYGSGTALETTALSAADRAKYLATFLQDLTRMLTLRLPGMLLSGAITAAVLMVAWPNWILHRRGLATEESYVPLNQWYLPSSVVFGTLGLFVVSLLMYAGGMAGGDSVFLTVQSILDICFLVQAAAALSRILGRTNAPPVLRFVVIALAVTFFQFLFIYVGCVSALFGSHGAISELLRKRRNGNNDQ